MINPGSLITDFIQVAKLARVTILPDMICAEMLPAPHSAPSSLPKGKMAVYVFMWGEQCLKVGKAGPNSPPRYTSHPYSPKSSGSNLAKSILSDGSEAEFARLDKSTVGSWIKSNTYRMNFHLDAGVGKLALGLLEAFLQCRLKPRFEGFKSQK